MIGGSEGSFTGDLLALIARADQHNLMRLTVAFPHAVVLYMAWQSQPEVPTYAQLAAALAELDKHHLIVTP